ncbi:MAG: 50S ribosomal protein L11 [Candidatus Nanoarchaeia archaeon]
MAKKVVVELMVDGGKATAGAALGGTLGPLKMNIGQVVSDINKKTEVFKGMKVPVKLEIDPETKEYTMTIGTPPISQLIGKEIGVEKGSGEPNVNKAGVIAIEQVIKVAKMKYDGFIVKDMKAAVKNVIGSCRSMGILVEGKEAAQVMVELNEGTYDTLITSEKTEVTDAEKKARFSALSKELDAKMKQVAKQKAEAKAAAEAAATAAAAAGGSPASAAPAAGAKPAPAAKAPAKK